MPYFFLYVVFIVIGLAFSISGALFESGNNKKRCILVVLAAVVAVLGYFFIAEVPSPEIYTINGGSLTGNAIEIKSEPLLTVWYTTDLYADPSKGQSYEQAIPLEKSMTVSAKSCFLGLKWSNLVSRDLIIGDNGEIDIQKPDIPGSSVSEIKASFVDTRFFPGDKISKEDIRVTGETISGDSVTIEDFSFYPDTVEEGENVIFVNYKNTSCETVCFVSRPEITQLEVNYTGSPLRVGDSIKKSDFSVTGIYENGEQKFLDDFSVEPSYIDREGKRNIRISKDGAAVTIAVNVLPLDNEDFLTAKVDAEDIIFVLDSVYLSEWGINVYYIAFDPRGNERYQFWMQFDPDVKPGSYDSSSEGKSAGASFHLYTKKIGDNWYDEYEAEYKRGNAERHGNYTYTITNRSDDWMHYEGVIKAELGNTSRYDVANGAPSSITLTGSFSFTITE